MAESEKGEGSMSGDGSPPSSWYDPPEPKYDYEIKSERPADAGDKCEKYACDEDAVKIVEVGDVRNPRGHEVTVCKNHYEDVIEDEIEAAENYEPDYDEED